MMSLMPPIWQEYWWHRNPTTSSPTHVAEEDEDPALSSTKWVGVSSSSSTATDASDEEATAKSSSSLQTRTPPRSNVIKSQKKKSKKSRSKSATAPRRSSLSFRCTETPRAALLLGPELSASLSSSTTLSSSTEATTRTTTTSPLTFAGYQSVLDRDRFIQALQQRGIPTCADQIDAFYVLLHRLHFPDLPQLVHAYYHDIPHHHHQDDDADDDQASPKAGGGGGSSYDEDDPEHRRGPWSYNKKKIRSQATWAIQGIPLPRGSSSTATSPRRALADSPHNSITSGSPTEAHNAPLPPPSRPKHRQRVFLSRELLQFCALSPTEHGFVTLSSTLYSQETQGPLTRLRIRLADGQFVSTMILRYRCSQSSPSSSPKSLSSSSKAHDDSSSIKSKKSKDTPNLILRASVCISSQCGCLWTCPACATCTRTPECANLTTGEMLEQVAWTERLLTREYLAWHGAQNNKNHKGKEPSVGGSSVMAESVLSQASSSSPASQDEEEDFIFEDKRPEEEDYKGRRSRRHQQQSQPRAPTHDFVRNVNFMAMGEPLHNDHNVVQACQALADPCRWRLAEGRITLCTFGPPEKMRWFSQQVPEAILALTLHAPHTDLNQQMVPHQPWSVHDLCLSLDEHTLRYVRHRQARLEGPRASCSEPLSMDRTQCRRAMVEYVMLQGPSSSLECAHQLGRLCQNRNFVVNLIPYLPDPVVVEQHEMWQDSSSSSLGQCPHEAHMQAFRAVVQSYGISCHIRQAMAGHLMELTRSRRNAPLHHRQPPPKETDPKNQSSCIPADDDDRVVTVRTHPKEDKKTVDLKDLGSQKKPGRNHSQGSQHTTTTVTSSPSASVNLSEEDPSEHSLEWHPTDGLSSSSRNDNGPRAHQPVLETRHSSDTIRVAHTFTRVAPSPEAASPSVVKVMGTAVGETIASASLEPAPTAASAVASAVPAKAASPVTVGVAAMAATAGLATALYSKARRELDQPSASSSQAPDQTMAQDQKDRLVHGAVLDNEPAAVERPLSTMPQSVDGPSHLDHQLEPNPASKEPTDADANLAAQPDVFLVKARAVNGDASALPSSPSALSETTGPARLPQDRSQEPKPYFEASDAEATLTNDDAALLLLGNKSNLMLDRLTRSERQSTPEDSPTKARERGDEMRLKSIPSVMLTQVACQSLLVVKSNTSAPSESFPSTPSTGITAKRSVSFDTATMTTKAMKVSTQTAEKRTEPTKAISQSLDMNAAKHHGISWARPAMATVAVTILVVGTLILVRKRIGRK